MRRARCLGTGLRYLCLGRDHVRVAHRPLAVRRTGAGGARRAPPPRLRFDRISTAAWKRSVSKRWRPAPPNVTHRWAISSRALTDFLRPSSERVPEVSVAPKPASPLPVAEKPQRLSISPESEAHGITAKPWMIAVGAAVAVAVITTVGGAAGFWAYSNRTKTGPETTAPVVADRSVIPETIVPAAAHVPAVQPKTSDPEHLLDSAWQAIRAERFGQARTFLQRYVDDPQSSKKEEARVLIADLNRSTKGAAATREGAGSSRISRITMIGAWPTCST